MSDQCLVKALLSNNSWFRQWALITLTRFHQEASDAIAVVRLLLKNETYPLNRARAAQFLALSQGIDPTKIIDNAIASTEDVIEVLEIMNIATQLYDAKGYQFNIPMRKAWLKPKKKAEKQQTFVNFLMQSRVNYLTKGNTIARD